METGRTGPSHGNTELLKTLLEYVIKVFYSEVSEKNMYLIFQGNFIVPLVTVRTFVLIVNHKVKPPVQ